MTEEFPKQEREQHLPEVISNEKQVELRDKFEVLNGKKVKRITVDVFGLMYIEFEDGRMLEIDPQHSDIL